MLRRVPFQNARETLPARRLKLASFGIGDGTPENARQTPRCLPSAAPVLAYAVLRSWFFSGRERMRLPVAKKMALHKAGARGGTGVSPMPPQKPALAPMHVSTARTAAARSIGQ